MTFPISSPSADLSRPLTRGSGTIPCPDRQSLETLLDGVLDPCEESVLRSHVATCALCQAELDQITESEALGDWLASARAHAPWPAETPSLRRVREALRRLPRDSAGWG